MATHTREQGRYLGEREVLTLLGRGRSNPEIAASLYVSEMTVKTHVQRILAKLGLRDRTQAVIFAYEAGVIQIGSHDQVARAQKNAGLLVVLWPARVCRSDHLGGCRRPFPQAKPGQTSSGSVPVASILG